MYFTGITAGKTNENVTFKLNFGIFPDKACEIYLKHMWDIPFGFVRLRKNNIKMCFSGLCAQDAAAKS